MPVLSAPLTRVSRAPADVPRRAARSWHAIELDFGPGEAVWILSHTESEPFMPPEASLLGVPGRRPMIEVNGLLDISRNAGYLSGRATITAPAYRFVDTDGALSALIHNKNLNLRSTFNATLREYEWDAGDPFPLPITGGYFHQTAARATFLIQGHDTSGGVISVETADINRGLDRKIFEPYQWQIRSSISATATFIPLTLPPALIDDQDIFFTRGQHYHDHAGVRGAYVRIDQTGEILFVTELEERSGIAGMVVSRSERLTVAASLEVPDDAEPANLPTVTEWIYIDEPLSAMAYAIAVGKVPNGGTLPAHWAAQTDPLYVDRYSYSSHATPFRLRFENPAPQTAKRFIETEILSAFPAVNLVNRRGALTFSPIITPTQDAAGQILLDPSNSVATNLTLRHDMTGVHSSIALAYDWDAQRKQFLSRSIYVSADSSTAHRTDRTRSVELKGLHSGIHTGTQVAKLAEALGDDSYFEKQHLDLESYINDVPLGTLVAVDFPHVYDDAAIDPGYTRLRRTMIVSASTLIRRTGTTRYTLTGTMQVASSSGAGNALHNLEIAEYKRGGVNLETVFTIVNNVVQDSGTRTLQMGTKYYFVDDANPGTGLEFPSDLTINGGGTGGRLEMWIFGPVDFRSTLDLTASSANAGGAGSSTSDSGTRGMPGAVGSTRPGGALKVTTRYRRGLSANQPYYSFAGYTTRSIEPAIQSGGSSRLASIVLDANDGRLSGVPANLGGTGGPGAGWLHMYDKGPLPQTPGGGGSGNSSTLLTYPGTGGGRGGGGFMLLSWGGALGGVVRTSGGRAGQPSVHDGPKASVGRQFVTPEGGGGTAGAFLWVVDGNHPPPPLSGSTVQAYSGAPWLVGIRANDTDFSEPFRSRHDPPGSSNLWRECSRILYTPASEARQGIRRYTDAIDEAFANQRDGKIALIVQDARPTNANVGDIWSTRANIEAQSYIAEILRSDGRGWTDYTAEDSIVYKLLLDNAKFDIKGDQIISSTSRPDDVEYESDLWHNPQTGIVVRLVRGGPPDAIIVAQGALVGDNRVRDAHFTEFAGGVSTWYVGVDTRLLPIFPPLARNAESNLPPPTAGTGTLPAPTGGAFDRYSYHAGLFTWTPAVGDVGTNLRYRVRRAGANDEYRQGQANYTFFLENMGPDAITIYVRLERPSDGAYSDELAITRPAEAGGSSGGGGGGGGGETTSATITNGNFMPYSGTAGRFAWTPVQASQVDGVGWQYLVERVGHTDGNAGTINGRAATGFEFTGLTPSTTYTWRVRIQRLPDYGPWVEMTGSTLA